MEKQLYMNTLLRKSIYALFATLTLVAFSGCSKDDLYLHYALKAAGKNKTELKAVLKHYRTVDKDPEKLKAAKYLIANMPAHYSYADTEFGVLSDALLQVLDRSGELYEDDFRTNRNINSISCIRTFTGHKDDYGLRVFAAPSAEPHLRRADTADTIRFYLANTQFQPRESLLFITKNLYFL